MGRHLPYRRHTKKGLILPGLIRCLCLAPILTSLSVFAADDLPWFGVALPPPLDDSAPVAFSDRLPHSAQFASQQQKYPELLGENIIEDVATIVEFSRRSRREKEVGDGQLWGRISGLPSGKATTEWAAEQFQQAGIDKVELQGFQQDADASLWLPLRWQMTLLAKSEFGRGSKDLILQSAMPLPPSTLPPEGVAAVLVDVGNGSPAATAALNLNGKIVVQRVIPQAHMVFERETTTSQARDFFQRGAVAVINVVDLPGNMLARDFSNCGGPCFNLGGRDGRFLLQVLAQAAKQNLSDQVRMSLSLRARELNDLQAFNALAIVPADPASPYAKENIIISAHADAWFDGAGDNADGLAVTIALAKHFAQRPKPLPRNLLFVASAGHHSSGLNGPRNVVSKNPELMQNTQLLINVEHVAQRNIVPARAEYADGYRRFTADSNEAPIVAGVTNQSPFLNRLISDGISRFGVNFVDLPSTMSSGEGGGYRQVNKALVTFMQSPPLYHTSGESLDIISAPGLERMAHFLADFIEQTAAAERQQLNPLPQ